jgi:hypothetical protein
MLERYKIAKNQEDKKEMRYYAAGIQKAQKELGLKMDSFPNLGMYGIEDSGAWLRHRC